MWIIIVGHSTPLSTTVHTMIRIYIKHVMEMLKSSKYRRPLTQDLATNRKEDHNVTYTFNLPSTF